MGQDGEHRFARRALNAPDGETAQADPRIMGVASQTAAVGAGRFVQKLKPKREEKGEDELDKRLAIIEQLKVGGLIVKIHGDGAVLTARFGALFHVSSSVELAVGTHETS